MMQCTISALFHSHRRRSIAFGRIFLPFAAGVLLYSGCAPTHTVQMSALQTNSPDGHVAVLNPLLAERIGKIAAHSPKFSAAWLMIRSSGVPVSIGTDAQLRSELPGWYRDHPRDWAGVTLTEGRKGTLERAVVALRLDAIEKTALDNPAAGTEYLDRELNRLLIHEIYGHLAPVVAAHDVAHACPDALRAGETTPCVARREAEIAAELANH